MLRTPEGQLPEGAEYVTPETQYAEYDLRKPVTPASIPTPPNYGYVQTTTSRCAVPVPNLSDADNFRQFYYNTGSFRRFWPVQS